MKKRPLSDEEVKDLINDGNHVRKTNIMNGKENTYMKKFLKK